jgi:phytoene dehydrogenase-like protein
MTRGRGLSLEGGNEAGSFDAVVVGSGPNGLAAAVTLTAAGLRVLVIEGAETAGGGCRTQELTLPGFRHDLCSAAHPLALASPFFRRFDLAGRGVRFGRPEVEFAHPLDGGRAGAVTRSVAETASRLGQDEAAYQQLFGPLTEHADAVVGAVLSSMRRPPADPAAVARYALLGLRSANHLATRFRTPKARGLLAGVAAHAMMPLSRPPTAGLALLLGTLAHAVGWPVVIGGSGAITDAMTEYVRVGGGRVETGWRVRSLAELPPAHAVLLDVTPRALLALAGDRLPATYARQLRRFRHGSGVFKADFALAGPVPWRSDDCRRAGTVHLGGTFEEVAAAEADVAAGRHPDSPYVLVVQPGVADKTRAPAAQQVLWTYCHVPGGSMQDMTSEIEAQIERCAPGFRDLVLARATRTAAEEEAQNPNYVGGDIASGVMSVTQTFARPVPRWNPYRTPLAGTYLCSASTPPGPGVHGRCGELAALSALREVFGVRRPPDLSVIRPATATSTRSGS